MINYLYLGIAIVIVIVVIYFVTRGGSGGGGTPPFDCTTCAPYACNTANTNCLTSCNNSNGCQGSATCNANNQCVGPAPPSSCPNGCGAVQTCINGSCVCDTSKCANGCADSSTCNSSPSSCTPACTGVYMCSGGVCICDTSQCKYGCADGSTCNQPPPPATCTPACTGVFTCINGTCGCDTAKCAYGCSADGTTCNSAPPPTSCLPACTGVYTCLNGNCGCDRTQCLNGCTNGTTCNPLCSSTNCLSPNTCVNSACTAPTTCTPACTGIYTCISGSCVCDTATCPYGCLPDGSACSPQPSAPCTQSCAAAQTCMNGTCGCNTSKCPNGCSADGTACLTAPPAACPQACTGVFTCSNGTCLCDTAKCPSGCADGNTCNQPVFSCDSCPPYNCAADGKSCSYTCTDSTSCAKGAQCVDSYCIVPTDVSTCGFYNYIFDSNGLPHCITQCASNTDCRSPATCINGVCTPPGLMTAADCAACPSGACNSASTACILPPPDGKWEGWATTTQFGQGEGTWPGSSWPALNLCNAIIGDPTRKDLPPGQQVSGQNTMGAAIPTRYVASAYGSRTEWLNAILASANTPTTGTAAPACYEIQPVSVYPNQISGGVDDWLNFCTGAECKDINDPTIAATYTGTGGTETEYPSYLVVPYEFCGGNCATNQEELATSGVDCFNTCSNIQELITDFGVTTGGQYCDISNLMAANRWDATQYMDEITPLNLYGVGIAGPDYGMPPGVQTRANLSAARLNWCSGQNMHFDMAETTPLWLGGLPTDTNPPPLAPDKTNSTLAITTGDSQIVVRYRRVPCNQNGQFDLSAKPPGYASGNATSTNCYDSNGNMQIPPPLAQGGGDLPTSLYCASTSAVCANGAPVTPPVVYGCAGWGASQGTFKPDAAFVAANGSDPTKWTSWPTSGVCVDANGCVMDINGNCSNPGGGGKTCPGGLGPLDCTAAKCTDCMEIYDSTDANCGGKCLPSSFSQAACTGASFKWCGS